MALGSSRYEDVVFHLGVPLQLPQDAFLLAVLRDYVGHDLVERILLFARLGGFVGLGFGTEPRNLCGVVQGDSKGHVSDEQSKDARGSEKVSRPESGVTMGRFGKAWP